MGNKLVIAKKYCSNLDLKRLKGSSKTNLVLVGITIYCLYKGGKYIYTRLHNNVIEQADNN
jgi:hypothetical protein